MDGKSFILAKFAELEKLKLGNFYFGTKGRQAPPGAKFQNVARFNFVLSGVKRMSLPLSGVETELDLRAGDVQVSDRNSWELTATFIGPCEILCVVPRNDYLRVSHYDINFGKNGEQFVKSNFYHTQHHYSEVLRHTANALCACAYGAKNDVARHLAKVLVRLAVEECSAVHEEEHGRAKSIFERIRRWMENHFTEDISRETAAKTFNITPSHVSRLFKQMTGGTFIDCMTSQRIEFAKTLLEESDMTVYQVAAECGYGNYVYFVRRFRETCGMPPGMYKSSHSRKT
jgi:AraC-like DNA-binding protein